MQLDRMPNWLKALLVFAALVGGLPSAAWAHTGHDHGPQSLMQRPVGAVPALDPVEANMGAECAVGVGHLLLQGFGVCVTAPAPTERVADPRKERDRVVVGVRAGLGATPANNPVQPLHLSDCCCGSIACHVGVDAPTLYATDHWRFGTRVELPPVLAMVGAIPGGIERPPRRSNPL
jgi:hypothetical protein